MRVSIDLSDDLLKDGRTTVVETQDVVVEDEDDFEADILSMTLEQFTQHFSMAHSQRRVYNLRALPGLP